MTVRARTMIAVALASATCAFAQFPGGGADGGPPGGPGGPGGGRGGDMQRGPGGMMGGDGVEQAKAQLKASDEEWQVLRPAIQKVVNARRAADSGLVSGQQRGMFGGRGGGRGGPGGGMGNDSFNGPNNSGPGGRGNRGGPPPAGDGGPNGGPPNGGPPNGGPPPADNPGGPPDAGPPSGQPPQQNNGQGGGNRQGNNGPNGGPNNGPNAGGPPGMVTPTGPVGAAMTELKTAAAKTGVKADELNSKIAAVRAERKKARDALAGAVDELKALVTPEQEAMLIALGYLE